jgi:hypothetical protein
VLLYPYFLGFHAIKATMMIRHYEYSPKLDIDIDLDLDKIHHQSRHYEQGMHGYVGDANK